MSNNISKTNGAITWKQVGVVIAIITLLGVGFSWTNTKADKAEVEKVESRVEKKFDIIREDIQKIYDLLIDRQE